ncbi:MAG: IS4 family transposase [Thiobacillaceae bacterium]
MVRIRTALDAVRSQLQSYQLIPAGFIEQLCKEAAYVWRHRALVPAMTVHLLILQLLANVSLEGLRRVAKIKVTAQAINAARKRLPLKVLLGLVEHVGHSAGKACVSTWKGLQVKVADGTSFLTEDTEQLAHRYGRARNQRGTSRSYPVPKLLALLDLTSGMICKVIALPWHRGERAGLSRMFGYLERGELLLGDRGLVSFAHLALLMAQGVECCMRLPRWLVVNSSGRSHGQRVRRLGRQDWLVRWTADRRPGWMTRAAWKKMPQELILRQISFRLCRRGFRTQWAWVVTTLTDDRKYSAQEIVDLYERRWQVEVYFRDLRKSLQFQKLSPKSIEAVRKQVLAFVLLYNLVRQIMIQAARQQGVEPERISFIDAVRWLLWSVPGEALPELVINPKRQRATQPRMIKRGRRRYPQLNGRRDQLSRPRHRAIV